ncbi:hypothetical protein [Candidatus Tisiphia endosymbiont of Mystacides longicornis]|uniref:hypothetical protein n=1 Tax=Candidatus Tisiphia endosymbiont of Mystacides longicornis TaxID=3139330 RepID=UPI003CCB0E3F
MQKKKIKGFLTSSKLKKLAKEQKMIIRESKITAKSVTKATLLASVKDEGTLLELMASLFEQDDIDITKQSLHAKINQPAVGFMKAVFDKLYELLIGNLANTISTKFKDILIVDSSEIKLNLYNKLI